MIKKFNKAFKRVIIESLFNFILFESMIEKKTFLLWQIFDVLKYVFLKYNIDIIELLGIKNKIIKSLMQ